jgi:hypothetical protein
MEVAMYDADVITGEILLSLDDWLTPFLTVFGDKVYLQALIIFLLSLGTAKFLSFVFRKSLLIGDSIYNE